MPSNSHASAGARGRSGCWRSGARGGRLGGQPGGGDGDDGNDGDAGMSGRVEARVAELGIALPRPVAPVANYVAFAGVAGAGAGAGLVVLSGQLPMQDGKVAVSGRLGADVTAEDATRGAALCFVNLLAQLREACGGDLDRVVRVVRLGGFIAATPEFTAHAGVMNGASDLAVAVFGDAGRHARSTVGVASLPLGAAVEVEGMFEIGA